MSPPSKTTKKRKKTTKKASRTRGGGGIKAPVCVRVGRTFSENEPAARQGNYKPYEGIKLCVNNKNTVTTTRKRPGRPRKLPSNPIAEATDVIYLSNAKSQGLPKYFPLKTRGVRGCGLRRIPNIISRNYQLNRHVVHPTPTIAPSHQCMSLPGSSLLRKATPLQSISKQVKSEEKCYLAEDLKDLVITWNSLPGNETLSIVNWLIGTPFYSHNLPPVIQKCHSAVTELFLPLAEENIQEYVEWLETQVDSKEKPHPTLQVASPPKVVVESQPSSLQNCCQWSSMETD